MLVLLGSETYSNELRQGVESGFQGRTNKFVDGCYSFWQVAVLALIQMLHSKSSAEKEEKDWSTDSTESCAAFDLSEEEDGTCNVDKTSHSNQMCTFEIFDCSLLSLISFQFQMRCMVAAHMNLVD